MFPSLDNLAGLSAWVFALNASKHSEANSAMLVARDAVTTVVNLGNQTGVPHHLASGLLYGLPMTQNQLPTQWLDDIGYNYQRSGGAQIPAPGRGWIWGLTEYQVSSLEILCVAG